MADEKIACYKFLTTIIFLIISISLLLVLRETYSFQRQTPPVGFRSNWSNICNLVVAGDSRSRLAVNPDQLVKNKSCKGVNFSFQGNALSSKYLDAVTTLLAPNPSHIIVFGITPHMFTPHAFNDNDFLRFKPPSLGEKLFSWAFGDKWPMFSTMTISELRYIISDGQYQRPVEITSNDNGWMAASCHIADDDSTELKSYTRNFQCGLVQQETMQTFFEKVSEWSSKGIFVVGFRPPTTEKMVNLENRLSGFNESDFIRRFEGAGGYWIKVPQYGVYRCYDGSHITADAAQELSHYLSQEICSRIPQLQATLCSKEIMQ